MEDPQTDAEVINLVWARYVPFLKRLIADRENKSCTVQPESLEILKYLYQVFTEADVEEKIDVYHACKDELEKWHQRYKDMNHCDKEKSIGYSGTLSENAQSVDGSQDKIIQNSSSGKDSTGKLAVVSVVSCSGPSSVGQNNVTERPGSTVIQDKIENPATTAGASYSAHTEHGGKWKLVNIKKEKEKPVQVPYAQPQVSPAGQATASAPSAQVQSNYQAENSAQGPKKPVEFVCASCQFHTLDETEFMKHADTGHRTDLSLWCNHCGMYFSDAGVLVAHIKENNCEKEEMIYRCIIKDCTFETPSGQMFVHHLCYCRKRSPYVFCVHCQKIFTLLHCLILHMQDECPFKEKNRKNPSAASSQKSAQPTPPSPQQPSVNPLLLAGAKPVQSLEKQPAENTQAAGLSNNKPVSAASPQAAAGRSRNLYSDSNESHNPAWKPKDSLNSQPHRRSAFWAKKVNDGDSSSGKKISEQPGQTLYNCPCCDFSASFKSSMNDHYISHHKNPNFCLVCNAKFESMQLFLDHFPLHEKGKDGNAAIRAVTENGEEDTDAEKISKSSSLLPAAALSQPDCSSEASMDMSDSPPELTDTSVKRYMCGFCTKKTFTLMELEDHIDSHHAVREEETYPYFYWPDPDLDYPANDTVLYECAYCSASRENLYHLKQHCNSLHPNFAFQVRGLKSKDCSMIKCGYCSYKVMSYELLVLHCCFHHPKRPVRAAGEMELKHPVKRKASGDSGKTLSKAAKEKLLYNGSEFLSLMMLLNHHDKSHKGMPMKYNMCQSEDGQVESNNFSLMHCTMCSFTGEEKLLYKHMSIKHKDSVGCAYCKKHFENMSKFKEHNEEMHEGKPLSTVSFNDALVMSESEESTTSPKASCSYSTDINGPFSYYGVKPEPLDLENITVNLEIKETSSKTKLPVVFLTQMFEMFPKVLVKDIYTSR